MIPGDGVRIECAFSSDPADPSPAYEEISSYVLLNPGISINRGRSPEGGSVSPGVCSLTLRNDDGRFTAENPSSPYYPNVTVGRRLRVSYRESSTYGTANLVPAATASVEDGALTSWWSNYFGAPAASTIANSATRAFDGTKSVLVTWPTAVAGVGAGVFMPDQSLVKGRTYVASVRVWVPAGSPAVKFGDAFGATPTATSTVTGAWQQLTISWTAAAYDVYLGVRTNTASTAGQQVWVDALQVDEATVGQFPATAVGSGPTFTTAQAYAVGGPVKRRYVGYVDDWPTSWPSGPSIAYASISATDRFKRLSGRRRLRTIVAEELALDSPRAYFPLAEEESASAAGDASARGVCTSLARKQYGTGGDLTFGAGTGPGTDGQAAPVFAPLDASNGVTLYGRADGSSLNVVFGTGEPIALEGTINTTTANRRALAIASDWGWYVAIEVSAANKLVVAAEDPWRSSSKLTAASAASVTDGATHHVAVTVTSTTATLYLDGVSVATLDVSSLWSTGLRAFNVLEVGGAAGALFAGTISNVAVYSTGLAALTAARVADHAEACLTGFAGERSDERVARLLGYAAVPTADQALDVGLSTNIDHVDTTQSDALAIGQRVAETESGVLLVDRDGRVALHGRGRRYNATVRAALTASQIRPNPSIVYNDQAIANDVTARRQSGYSARVTDEESIDLAGVATADLDLVTASNAEVDAAAAWKVATSSRPASRFTGAVVDLLDDTVRGLVIDLEISDRLTVSGLPSQAPGSLVDLFLEGYSETISDSSWDLSLNTSSVSLAGRVWQLEDPTYGAIDSTNRVAY